MAVLGRGILIGVLVLILLVAICVIGVYQHRSAALAATEAAIGWNLRTIGASEIQYFNTHSRTFGTFDQIVKEGMLTNRFSGEAPIVDDYTFTLKVTPKSVNQGSSYTLNADSKTRPWERAGRHLYVDSSSPTTHVNPDRPASAPDPAFVE